jgi:hypothetical protein
VTLQDIRQLMQEMEALGATPVPDEELEADEEESV